MNRAMVIRSYGTPEIAAALEAGVVAGTLDKNPDAVIVLPGIYREPERLVGRRHPVPEHLKFVPEKHGIVSDVLWGVFGLTWLVVLFIWDGLRGRL